LALSGEPFIKEIENVLRPGLPVLSINEVWGLQLQKTAYQKKVLEVWSDTATRTKDGKPIDAFIMPIAPYAAVLHGQYGHVSYTSWVCSCEMLMRSMLSIIRLVLSLLLLQIKTSTKRTIVIRLLMMSIRMYGRNVFPLIVLMLDNPEVYHGGPVAVQVVGRRLREEQTLEIAEIVSNTLPPIK
jgi:amidase